MGEYASYNGERIKIGTCETMYYLRYEDRDKVTRESGSLDPSKEHDLFWRLPWPDEDQDGPGGYEDCGRGLMLVGFEDETTMEDPGSLQMKHESGLLMSVKCFHQAELPEGSKDIKPFWNGRHPNPFELIYVKNTGQGLKPIVRCTFCHKMWRYPWADVLPCLNIRGDAAGLMKARLQEYADHHDS
jgi:hypothetical protein